MKRTLLFVWLSLVTMGSGLGQSADNLVLQGRNYLANRNFTNANASFAAAVALATVFGMS